MLKDRLTPLQYHVTQEGGTEPPFRNEFWDHHEPGVYVDVVSGEPLFASVHKFDSGTGWPSFTRPIDFEAVSTRTDLGGGMVRTEVRSKRANSHLGHVFEDGPGASGLRYCINSAALRFVPLERLEAEGLGRYLHLFRTTPAESGRGPASQSAPAREGGRSPMTDIENPREPQGDYEVATLAGGCFWGVEELFRKLPGVVDTTVGYTGGRTQDPTYEQVKTGRTGHAEAIRIVFDPKRVTYRQILEYFFRLHDPTTPNRQGNDVGTQYRSAIFVHDGTQRKVAAEVREAVDRSGKWPRRVVTEIVDAGPFYPAEEYHQDYLQKHPEGYTCHFLRD